ncbi:hypothetical protein HWI79_2698 [Cryptosporidium felis]|nr:hypothetical protein HWI79_2698 [Cryptosporidium felis]
MENLNSVIRTITDGLCCLSKFGAISGEERHLHSENFQDLNDYYSYFNTGPRMIDNDLFERNLFTSNGEEGNYIEISRNNKLFGLPVSLKSFSLNPNKQVGNRIFDHLEIAQSDPPVKSCHKVSEPINYYKDDQSQNRILLPKSNVALRKPKATKGSSSPTPEGSKAVGESLSPRDSAPPTSPLYPLDSKLDASRSQANPCENHSVSRENYLKAPPTSFQTLFSRSNPPVSITSNHFVQKTPSLPVINTNKIPSRCPPLQSFEEQKRNAEENDVILTKYGAYLLGL